MMKLIGYLILLAVGVLLGRLSHKTPPPPKVPVAQLVSYMAGTKSGGQHYGAVRLEGPSQITDGALWRVQNYITSNTNISTNTIVVLNVLPIYY